MMNKRRTKEIGRTKIYHVSSLGCLVDDCQQHRNSSPYHRKICKKEVMEQVNTPQPEIANIPELQSEEIQQTVALPAKKRNRKVNTYRSKQEYTRFCGI